MSYVTPNSTLRILKGVPLDPTYDHTLYFNRGTDPNPTAFYQTTYFASKQKYIYSNLSYQRVNKNTIRIKEIADNLYDCNYLMFMNDRISTNKWFYAFIKEVNYINEHTTEVVYEIDDMQTWYFDYELKPCFVEREHSATDNIGDNTLPENIELGPYIYHDLGLSQYFENTSQHPWDIVVISTVTENDGEIEPGTGRLWGFMYTGLVYNIFTSASDANAFINLVTEQAAYGEDSILAIIMMPHVFTQHAEGQSATEFLTESVPQNLGGLFTGFGNDGVTPSYLIPKNNKLFTYPYNFLYVTNSDGNSAEYRYEHFKSNSVPKTCEFGVRCCISADPEAQLVPLEYKGVHTNYNEQLRITAFPACAFITDAFKAWWALNGTKEGWAIGTGIGDTIAETLSAVANPAKTPIGVASQVVGVAASTAHRVENIVVPHTIAASMPPHAKGQATKTLDMSMGVFGYRFYAVNVREEYAHIIDEYFSMFGYATHRVKVPNRNVRPQWTYTQTVGCVITETTGLPADAATKICEIYDKGITFWKHPENVGNYNLNNRPEQGGG